MAAAGCRTARVKAVKDVWNGSGSAVGSMVLCFFGRRCLPSVFGMCCASVQAHYDTLALVWRSVRTELRTAMASTTRLCRPTTTRPRASAGFSQLTCSGRAVSLHAACVSPEVHQEWPDQAPPYRGHQQKATINGKFRDNHGPSTEQLTHHRVVEGQVEHRVPGVRLAQEVIV